MKPTLIKQVKGWRTTLVQCFHSKCDH